MPKSGAEAILDAGSRVLERFKARSTRWGVLRQTKARRWNPPPRFPLFPTPLRPGSHDQTPSSPPSPLTPLLLSRPIPSLHALQPLHSCSTSTAPPAPLLSRSIPPSPALHRLPAQGGSSLGEGLRYVGRGGVGSVGSRDGRKGRGRRGGEEVSGYGLREGRELMSFADRCGTELQENRGQRESRGMCDDRGQSGLFPNGAEMLKTTKAQITMSWKRERCERAATAHLRAVRGRIPVRLSLLRPADAR